MDPIDLAYTAGRTVIMYVFVLIVVRLLGKRTVGDVTPFDLVVAFIISEVVDEPIYGDVPLIQALVLIATVGAVHWINSYLGYRWPLFEKVTGGEPLVLVRNGKKDPRAMAKERVSDQELQSMLRENEIEKLDEIKQATLETSGKLTVLKTEQAKELQKSDLDQLTQKGKGRK
jgi:uncharacterized membrane protein YcaP (DUF421 family)